MSESPRKPELLLRRLEWTVIRRLDGVLQGNYRTMFRGSGMDLAGLREYQMNDDVRHIDWNVTARLQEPYIRQYHEDREITAWFLLDVSPSVDFGSSTRQKREVLVEATSALARIMPAAINTSRRAASPKTTRSPPAAASRTRAGSPSSAMKGIFSARNRRARFCPLRP